MQFEDIWLDPIAEFLADMMRARAGQRGISYARRGKVLQIDLDDPKTISGLVEGSRAYPYVTRLRLGQGPGEYLATECSCPMAMDCKHTVALALSLLYEACDRGSAVARDANAYCGASWPLARKVHALRLSEEVEALFTDKKPLSKMASGSAHPDRRAERWWEDLIQAESAEERSEALWRGMKERTGTNYLSWYYGTCIHNLLAIENPLDLLSAFDAAVEDVAHGFRSKIKKRDPDLAAFLESEAALKAREQFEPRNAERKLFQWLEKDASASDAPRSYVDVVWLTRPGYDGFPLLCFQLLLTTKRLRRAPRHLTAIEALAREADSGVRAFSPEQTRLISWIASLPTVPFCNEGGHVPDDTVLAVGQALEWIALWGVQGMIAWADGGTAQFDLRPAHLTLCPAEDDHLVWSVAFPPGETGNDAAIPLGAADVMSEYYAASRRSGEMHVLQIFVRRGNTLHRLEAGGMPFEVLAALRRIPELPAERLRDTPAGVALVRRLSADTGRGLAGREASVPADAGLVRGLPVVPEVEWRYDEDKALLSVAVRARAHDGTTFYRTHVGEWEQVSQHSAAAGPSASAELAPLAAEEAGTDPFALEDSLRLGQSPFLPVEPGEPSPWFIARQPRREDVAPLEEWLSKLIPDNALFVTDEAGTPVLEWKLHPASLSRLVQWWPARPRGVTYLGTRAFQNVITPRPVGRFSVKVESSGMNWLEVFVEMEQELDALSLDEVAAALNASQEPLLLLSGGRLYRRGDIETYRRKLDALDRLGLDLTPGVQRVHALQLSGLGDEPLREIAETSADLRDVAREARDLAERFKGIPAAAVHAATAAALRPYQREGTDFIVWAAKTFGGAILADDMGLGKTIEVLAALTALQDRVKKHRPSLVVCPASVAHNWQREAQRFAPHLKTVVIERGTARKAILERLGDFDLVIKNYALTRRDADLLAAQDWLMLCVDEAQAIKNPSAQITRTVKSLRAAYRFALTGTPIENRLTDLWSITDFVAPGYLQSLDRFERRVKERGTKHFYAMLRARLRPILIRRLKAVVAPELPPRIEERRDCPMVPSQRKDYLAELKKARMLLEGAPDDRLIGKQRIIMLTALTRLRQICCDPALVGLPDKGSGKVNEVLELVSTLLDAGHKVLLFSQFVRMLRRLETMLAERDVRRYVLTGQTTKRQELVDAFEADDTPSVFLISLKAGGQGLNLVSASHVILFDPWWNPAVEAQAIDRTHRIGQDKTVVAFRLVTQETIEERILELQERKLGIIKNVLDEETFNRTLTREDLQYLLRD